MTEVDALTPQYCIKAHVKGFTRINKEVGNMQMQINQVYQFNRFNNHFVTNAYKTDTTVSVYSRRRMIESQEKAQKIEAATMTLSAEAMALIRQEKAMSRLEFARSKSPETEAVGTSKQNAEEQENVSLTDEELYDELLNQVKIWGDKSNDLLHDYNHKENAEMVEKRMAALNEMRQLAEMQKSEMSKMQREAQKAAETASMQQEEISQKNSELLMMIESFEEQDEENIDAADQKENDDKEHAESTDNMMEGRFGAVAVKGELGILDTINAMEQSSTDRIEASDHSIKGVELERKNIVRANAAENFTIKEKIAAMEDFVCSLANNEEVKESFKQRIRVEEDPEVREKLEAKMKYFNSLPMKGGLYALKEDREYALQERITARDLRIAHLGDNHFSMAERQKSEMQSIFEENILKSQGQNSVLNRMEDITERLQEKLDERDQIEEDTAPDEEIHDKEDQEKDKVHNQEAQEEMLEKNSNED